MTRLAQLNRPLGLSTLSGLAFVALTPAANAQLIHRYSFDGAGPTVTDSVGAADGTAMNGAVLAGGEVSFDGVDDFVELPGGLASASETRSFEFWFNWTGGGNWQRLMDFGDNNGSQGITYFVISPQGSNPASAAAMKTVYPGVSQKVYSLSQTATGVLTHVCVTYDSPNDTMSIYLDGAYQDQVNLLENLSELNDVDCWLGRSQWTQDPHYQGTITEFRIYEGVLTAAQVAASYAGGPDMTGIGSPYCQPAVLNSTGAPSAIGASGSSLVASNSLVLEATDLPTSAFGFFLTSQTQAFVMNPGGSQGNLCLGGSIGRYVGPGQIQNSGAGGSMSLALDLTQTPTPTGLVSVAPGETWNFQGWFRDAVMGSATSNFTNGLEITFQ